MRPKLNFTDAVSVMYRLQAFHKRKTKKMPNTVKKRRSERVLTQNYENFFKKNSFYIFFFWMIWYSFFQRDFPINIKF